MGINLASLWVNSNPYGKQMSKYLDFKAGDRAFHLVRDRVLVSDDVKIMDGASGAAKYLVLSDLDRYLFSEWFRNRKKPLVFAVTSIGAWRFASAACPDFRIYKTIIINITNKHGIK